MRRFVLRHAAEPVLLSGVANAAQRNGNTVVQPLTQRGVRGLEAPPACESEARPLSPHVALFLIRQVREQRCDCNQQTNWRWRPTARAKQEPMAQALLWPTVPAALAYVLPGQVNSTSVTTKEEVHYIHLFIHLNGFILAGEDEAIDLDCSREEKKRRAFSPPSHVIFCKALMEATARHQPKGCDLEDMYAFLPGQLSAESPERQEQPVQIKAPVGNRRRDLSLPTPDHRKGKGTCARARANSRNKGLVWKPKVGPSQN
eukprot:Skav219783  [mRNA]  locus=scaffold3701:45872:49115:+ [translate_table: standard]